MPNLGVWEVVGLAFGIVLLGAGLWMVLHERRGLREDEPDSSRPTKLTLGLACLFGGYHAVAWSISLGGALLHVPLDHWWVVAGVIVTGVAGALLAQALENRG